MLRLCYYLTFAECGQTIDNTSPMLLLLYEFEIKARLGDADLEKVLDKALLQPYAEPKTFEVMAGKWSLMLDIQFDEIKQQLNLFWARNFGASTDYFRGFQKANRQYFDKIFASQFM